jgi:hypothetical protein
MNEINPDYEHTINLTTAQIASLYIRMNMGSKSTIQDVYKDDEFLIEEHIQSLKIYEIASRIIKGYTEEDTYRMNRKSLKNVLSEMMGLNNPDTTVKIGTQTGEITDNGRKLIIGCEAFKYQEIKDIILRMDDIQAKVKEKE